VRAPEITYRFIAPTDTAGGTFDLLSRQVSQSAGVVTIEILIADLPKDRILVLTNAALTADPGAAQLVVEMKIQGVTQAGLIFDIATDITLGAADIEKSLNWTGSVYIQGGGVGRNTVRAVALFDAAVAANNITFGAHGIIIPHGNVGSF